VDFFTAACQQPQSEPILGERGCVSKNAINACCSAGYMHSFLTECASTSYVSHIGYNRIDSIGACHQPWWWWWLTGLSKLIV
jgi:hypothetical protein